MRGRETQAARGDQSGWDAASRDGDDEISIWEWLTGAIGLALVVGALFVLLRDARGPARAPDLAVRVDSVTRASAGWVAHVTTRNAGTASAAEVSIEGELVTGADTARAEATMDLVPGGATRTGGLLFARDPRAGTLVVRARGYREP